VIHVWFLFRKRRLVHDAGEQDIRAIDSRGEYVCPDSSPRGSKGAGTFDCRPSQYKAALVPVTHGALRTGARRHYRGGGVRAVQCRTTASATPDAANSIAIDKRIAAPHPATPVARLPHLGHLSETFLPRGCQVYPQPLQRFCGRLGIRGSFGKRGSQVRFSLLSQGSLRGAITNRNLTGRDANLFLF
jgi:hypothetical protein